jgi:hypothetical protein
MKREEWENTATEQNAKAEQWGAFIAGFWFFSLVIFVLALWNPYVLFAIPLMVNWLYWKRKTVKKSN